MTLAALFVAARAFAGQTIVVVGDSLSSGYGLSAEQSWVAMLRERLDAARRCNRLLELEAGRLV